MIVRTFTAPDVRGALSAARSALGEDAMIVRTRGPAVTESRQYEIIAAPAREVDKLRRRLEPASMIDIDRRSPYTVALAGPAGSGKTTTLIKLALHSHAFGARNVALVTLDTYRVAAIDEIQTYAEIADLPVEIVYSSGDVLQARKRLNKYDVILIDTPGRPDQGDEWMPLLHALKPDEVHLTLPATVRTDVARAFTKSFAACNPTHQLLTRFDEVPNECGVAAVAANIGLPARWVSTGREVPADLRPGAPFILSTIGNSERDPWDWAVA